jgi:hypothetical protein
MDEVHALAADLGGFISSHHAQICASSRFISLHTLAAERQERGVTLL